MRRLAAAGLAPLVIVTAAAAARPEAPPLDPALGRSLAAMESSLAALRGLPFKSEVKSAGMTREGTRAYIEKVIGIEYPGERLEEEEAAMRYFGLLDPGRSLKAIYLDVMGEQVAGVYDPPSKTLFVVSGMPAGPIALVHELSHALMDQHFDLDSLERRARDSDDRSLALSALIEGEATMTMTLWTVQNGADPNVAGLEGVDPDEMMRASQAGMSDAPPFLKETLLFPYVTGMAWTAEIMRRGGGLKALDPFFLDPPDSSEQILHPAKALAPRDAPSAIEPSALDPGFSPDARTIKRDAMGEFGIRFLLGGAAPDPNAVAAAEGWDGDLYRLARTSGGDALSWISVWDSDDDAAQFEAAVGSWLGRRGGSGVAGRKGRVVAVAEGASPKARLDALLSRIPAGIDFR